MISICKQYAELTGSIFLFQYSFQVSLGITSNFLQHPPRSYLFVIGKVFSELWWFGFCYIDTADTASTKAQNSGMELPRLQSKPMKVPQNKIHTMDLKRKIREIQYRWAWSIDNYPWALNTVNFLTSRSNQTAKP